MSVNKALAERFGLIARLQDLLGEDRFKAISHDRAARAIEALPMDLGSVCADAANAKKRLMEIDGIGPRIADKIIEFCATGQITELRELQAKVPAGVVELMQIPGLGPKTAAVLWKEGGVTTIDSLRELIASGKILDLPRMGEKAVEKLKASISLAEEGSKRLALGLAMPVA